MKNLFRYILIPIITLSFFSCKKDNYSQPGTFLTGAILYNSDTIFVERNQVPYQLYQYGFGKVGPIGATFAQDGTYSQALFNGDYKLIIPNGQGPFLWKQDAAGNPDSLAITLKGSQNVNLDVTPYYMPKSGVVGTLGRNVNGSFAVDQIIKGADAKDIEYVSIYINRVQFVGTTDQVASRIYPADGIIDSNKIEFSKFIPLTALSQDHYYIRFGIKMVNVEDLIFTSLFTVDLGEIDNYKRIEAETGTLVGNATIATIEGSNVKYITGITTPGDGVDINFNVATAGTYVINIGGGTDIKGTTQGVYIDGNATSSKEVLYPKQGGLNFDISPIEYDLSAGDHVLSIRKTLLSKGEANIDYVDLFRLKK